MAHTNALRWLKPFSESLERIATESGASTWQSGHIVLVHIGREIVDQRGQRGDVEAAGFLFQHRADVFGGVLMAVDEDGFGPGVAADGFVGNVLLKNTEGVIAMIFGLIKGGLMDSTKGKLAALLAKDTFRGIKRSFDSTEIGGAPLLGVEGAVIKAHGNSNARAIFCAIRQAKSMVDGGVVDVIRDEVAKLSVGEEQA